jgi:hypothetical protein
MIPPRHFDLVITTTQYAVRDAHNVLRLPITVSNQDKVRPDRVEQRWLDGFAHPRRLLVIGGKTSLWRFGPDVIVDAASRLLRRAELEGGSVIALTSPRTSPDLLEAAWASLGEDAVVNGQFPRYGALLHGADEIHVTGDSVSMLSDAVVAGKPVGLIPLQPDLLATAIRAAGRLRGRAFRMRRLDKFWDDLRARGLVGTIEEPRFGVLDFSAMDRAVGAVRALLDDHLRLPTPIMSSRKSASLPAQEAAGG